jgi:GGDEF domain-containing protein
MSSATQSSSLPTRPWRTLDEAPTPQAEAALTAAGVDVEGLKQRIYHDPLTGSPNLAAWKKMEASGSAGPAKAVIDANGLKLLNDSIGHSAGNALLQALHSSLERHLSGVGAEFARVGGDEWFAHGPDPATLDTALRKSFDDFRGAEIEYTDKSGATATVPANMMQGFAHAVGDTIEAADAQLEGVKNAQTKAGVRTERGVLPRRATEAGRQSERRATPARTSSQLPTRGAGRVAESSRSPQGQHEAGKQDRSEVPRRENIRRNTSEPTTRQAPSKEVGRPAATTAATTATTATATAAATSTSPTNPTRLRIADLERQAADARKAGNIMRATRITSTVDRLKRELHSAAPSLPARPVGKGSTVDTPGGTGTVIDSAKHPKSGKIVHFIRTPDGRKSIIVESQLA